MLEKENQNKQNNIVSKHRKRYSYGFICGVFAILAIVLLLNVLLIYNMTVKQSETIGQDQMEIISRDLQSILADSEYMTRVLANNVEERMEQGASQEEMDVFFEEQSVIQKQLS